MMNHQLVSQGYNETPSREIGLQCGRRRSAISPPTLMQRKMLRVDSSSLIPNASPKAALAMPDEFMSDIFMPTNLPNETSDDDEVPSVMLRPRFQIDRRNEVSTQLTSMNFERLFLSDDEKNNLSCVKRNLFNDEELPSGKDSTYFKCARCA